MEEDDFPWLIPAAEEMLDHQIFEREKPPTRRRDLVKFCKRCRHWKRKTDYYDTCHKGINCFAPVSGSASNDMQGASHTQKVSKVACDPSQAQLLQQRVDGPRFLGQGHNACHQLADNRVEMACKQGAGKSASNIEQESAQLGTRKMAKGAALSNNQFASLSMAFEQTQPDAAVDKSQDHGGPISSASIGKRQQSAEQSELHAEQQLGGCEQLVENCAEAEDFHGVAEMSIGGISDAEEDCTVEHLEKLCELFQVDCGSEEDSDFEEDWAGPYKKQVCLLDKAHRPACFFVSIRDHLVTRFIVCRVQLQILRALTSWSPKKDMVA
jgi:hypothetical protein